MCYLTTSKCLKEEMFSMRTKMKKYLHLNIFMEHLSKNVNTPLFHTNNYINSNTLYPENTTDDTSDIFNDNENHRKNKKENNEKHQTQNIKFKSS